jgi:hypothetical protein
MLRSTVIRGSQPILASAWSPDNSSILYSQGPYLFIQSLTISSKPQRVNERIHIYYFLLKSIVARISIAVQ